MASFQVRELLALCLFLVLFAPALVDAAPRPTAGHLRHAKRSFFDFKWGGRLFGGDRWGDVLNAPPKDGLVLDNSVSPAINKGEAPSTLSTPLLDPTPGRLTTNPLPSGTANELGSRPTVSPSSSTTRTPEEPEEPTSSTEPPARSTSTPKPTSSTSTPRPKPPTSTPRPTSSSTPVRPTSSKPTSTTPVAPPSQPSQPATGDVVSASDEAAYLKAHNDERAKRGAKALTWDDRLASAAKTWAQNCQFKHSGGTLGPFGENLAAGTGGLSIAAGIELWNNERPDYDPNNPEPSHWTQVVWKASTHVGCFSALCHGIFGANNTDIANFIVCEYSPQGNVIGLFPDNVQK